MKTILYLAALCVVGFSRVVNIRKWYAEHGAEVGVLTANEPTICDSVQQYSGYFSAGGNKKYFYWFFESRNSPTEDPLVMWLTGGPGCSSMLALFTENGPCSVNKEGTDTENNPFSWNTKANLMFVDQPPGTGFSTGTHDRGETGVGDDMYQFLQSFIKGFPQYFKNGFYVFGESYAGHYVPAITYRIFQGNQKKEGTYIPLVALGIGNGLTDPYIQYAYYAQMAYNSTTADSVISQRTYNEMTAAIPQCQKDIQKCNANGGNDCTTAYNFCNVAETSPVTATGVNPYNLDIPCAVPPLCYDFSNVDKYLNSESVQKQLGVDKKWEECNNAVNFGFEEDWMVDYQTAIPPQLANGTRVLIYAGDLDFICNYLGNQAWALAMNWPGKAGFNNVPVRGWSPDGTERGKIRTYNNFTFLQVYKAGHMVPRDQPEASLYMLDQFLSNNLK